MEIDSALQSILSLYPPKVAKTLLDLQDWILSVFPEMKTKPYPGWKALGFIHPRSGYVCGIFLGKENVRVCFEWGALLTDSQKHLQPGGRQVRTLTCEPDQPLPKKLLHGFIQQALDLPLRKADKLQLLANYTAGQAGPEGLKGWEN